MHKDHKLMISVSVSQKQVVMDFFANDIKTVGKYFNAIGFDYNEEFRFDVFKEFIYAAAGMFKDLDNTIYNQELVTKFNTIRYLSDRYGEFEQRSSSAMRIYTREFLGAQENYIAEKKVFENLKAELQMLIANEQTLTQKREMMEGQLGAIPPDQLEKFEFELKRVRREQVDTIHMLGTHRRELEERSASLKAFEDLHKEEFLKYFNEVKEKITYQLTEALNYFGFDFNEALFRNSERSGPIQRFKREAGIQGNMNLCKYVEYYLRSVVTEALADIGHKERLLIAKRYCEQHDK